MKTGLIAVLASLVGLGAFAEVETYTFVATNVYNANWGDPANWQTSDGSPATLAPTNGEDVVLPDLTIKRDIPESVTLKTGTTSAEGSTPYLKYPAVSPTVGKLTGSHQWVIRFAEPVTYIVQKKRCFTVADPDDFHGFFFALDALNYLTLPSTAGHSLKFPNVSARSRVHVEVPTAGTSASLESVYEDGALEKNGAGELEIKGLAGVNTDVYVQEGSVVLSGGDDTSSLEGLLAKAAVHFDPSVDSTLEKFDGEDGLVCVSRMNDVRGADVFHAVTNDYRSTAALRVPYCHAPFVSPATSPTGLRFLDFGSKQGRTDCGPTNCFLELKQAVNNIRDVFYVVETPTGSKNCNPLGSKYDNVYDFLKEATFLFSAYQPCIHVWGGDIAINGERRYNQEVSPDALTNCYVVSVGTLADARASTLGCERNYMSGTGGFRLGEMLIFTNELTRAERVRVNAYLNAKWRTGETVRDGGFVFAPTQANSIGVPEGHSVHVRAVSAPEGLVKTGGGTLKVDRLYPETTPVTLEGGDVAFGSFPAVEPKVADNPYIWLDATAAGTLIPPDGAEEGSKAVAKWKDRRADKDLAAVCPDGASYLPSVTTVNGLTGVDFGKRSAPANPSYMTLPNWKATANVYAGFIVVKCNGGQVHNIFGCSQLDLYRPSTLLLFNTYMSPVPLSAAWTIDGNPADPIHLTNPQALALQDLDYWHVVSFSSTRVLRADGVSTDRGSVNGEQTVGEMILFDRAISTEERVATEAYLMKKWLHKNHPDLKNRQSLVSVDYPKSKPNVVSSDGDSQVTVLSGGTGDVVKRGVGSVTVSTAEGIRSVTVEAGSLVLPGKMAFIEKEALFHFDATVPESFETTVGTDYAGNVVTNVDRWVDCRFNGFGGNGVVPPYAQSTNLISALPTLVEVETATGVRRKVLDCGKFRTNTSAFSHTTAAALNFDQAFTNVREVYGVVADAHNEKQGWFWGDWKTPRTYDYAREYSNGGLFQKNDANAFVKEGDIRLDGTGGHAISEIFPAGFHLLGVVTTGDTKISDFGLDRTYRAGGVYIGESLAFSRTLTTEERDYLEKYLMHKWLGTEAVVFTNAYDSVSVAGGARLGFDGVATAVVADEVSGGGAIDAERVIAGALTTMALDAEGFAPLTVSGTLELAPGAVVTIPVAGNVRDLLPGKYALASAASVEGLAGVTVSSDLTRRFSVTLSVEDGVLCATLQKLGMAIIVR